MMEPFNNILHRAPPADLEKNIQGLKQSMSTNLDATEALLKRHQIPFRVLELAEEGEKPFLLCQSNKVGEKYRSPWTNNLHPGGEPDPTDSDEIRRFETKMNHVWDAYKNLYYGHDSIGSVYLFPTDKGSFQGFFGIQKKCSSGSWNSMHLVHVDTPEENMCNYRVESTIMMAIEPETNAKATTKFDISALLSKEVTKNAKVQPSMVGSSHIENIGQLIEAIEIDLRSAIERVHVPKTQEIMEGIQKEEEKSFRPPVNPLMGMILQSDLLKKKLAKENSPSRL